MIALPRLDMALRVWRRHVRILLRHWRSAMLPPLLDPFFFFIAFGLGLGAYVASIDGVSYREFLAPGLLASTTMWSASFEMTYAFYWRMTDSGVHDNIVSTPVEPEDVVAGELLWAGTCAIVYGAGFLLVIAALGFVSSPWAVVLPAFLFVGGITFGALAMLFSVLVSRIEYFTFYFTLAVSPLFLFGGIFFPTSALPQWAQILGWFTPTLHLADISRALTAGPPTVDVLLDVVWLAVVAAAVALVPIARYRRRVVA